MKQSEVLTIEKLKLGMENENKHETTNTAELLRNLSLIHI